MPGYAGPVAPTEPNQLPRLPQRFKVERVKQPAGIQDRHDSSPVSLRTGTLELEYVVWQYNLRRGLLAPAVRWPSARGSTARMSRHQGRLTQRGVSPWVGRSPAPQVPRPRNRPGPSPCNGPSGVTTEHTPRGRAPRRVRNPLAAPPRPSGPPFRAGSSPTKAAPAAAPTAGPGTRGRPRLECAHAGCGCCYCFLRRALSHASCPGGSRWRCVMLRRLVADREAPVCPTLEQLWHVRQRKGATAALRLPSGGTEGSSLCRRFRSSRGARACSWSRGMPCTPAASACRTAGKGPAPLIIPFL